MQSPAIIALCVVAVLAVGAAVLLYRRQAALIRDATRRSEEIDREEHRMFAFLHGLGDALASDETAARMYEIIVKGAVDVTGADGGALYLHDHDLDELVPTFLTRGCPPLTSLPPDIVSAAVRSPKSVSSYLRLASTTPGDGIIGRAFESDGPLRVDDLTAEPGCDSDLHVGVSAMAAPLIHGHNRLGVLAIANRHSSRSYDEHDHDLFRSVSEQAAFALGNALIHQEAADKKRIEEELKSASEIQRILLPTSSPQLEGFRIAGENYPAKIVSGDYYDFIHVDDDHLGVAIADVSGKGIPASLIMAMCRTVLRAHAPGNHSPADVLSTVNRLIFPDIREDMFISMAYLIVARNSGETVIARAGHDPPMLYLWRDERIETVKPSGLAVGIDEGPVFDRVTQDHTLTFERGDVLLLYTDGVNEALDHRGEEFGIDRLSETFTAAASHGAEAVLSAVMTAVREHAGETRQSDDITLIAVEKL